MHDTIAAISTPLGLSGIGIVRLSGPKSITIVDEIFQGKGIDSLKEALTYRAYYGHIMHPVKKEMIEEVICLVMRAPKSFTREDVVEINCHGGSLPLNRVLEVLLDGGARLAEPGEFTKRAFLNGRIDLSQAEAVMDIINARTEEGLDIALWNLKGNLSLGIKELRGEVISLLAQIEALLDFPEDEIPGFASRELQERMVDIGEELEKLLLRSHEGRIMREGVKTAIIGRPNVGKSSLLNALVGEKRAIVTDIPGTTRDSIEEIINIGGIPLVIADTAGIRDTQDLIETEGVLRSREYLRRSQLLLLVIDVHEGIKEEDVKILGTIEDKKVIIVFNKVDLEKKISKLEAKTLFPDQEQVWISLLKGEGLQNLKDTIVNSVLGERQGEGPVINRPRHIQSIKGAKGALERALQTYREGLPIDFISMDLREVGERLGEITGETLLEDVIDKIFSQFCLGK